MLPPLVAAFQRFLCNLTTEMKDAWQSVCISAVYAQQWLLKSQGFTSKPKVYIGPTLCISTLKPQTFC